MTESDSDDESSPEADKAANKDAAVPTDPSQMGAIPSDVAEVRKSCNFSDLTASLMLVDFCTNFLLIRLY